MELIALKMKKQILLLLVILLVLPFISAVVVHQQSTDFNLTMICTNNGTYCSGSAVCNGTLLNSNGEAIINNVILSKTGSVYFLPVNTTQSVDLGEYQFNSICVDGTAKSETWLFYVTPNGELPTTASGILYIGLFFILMVLLGFLIYGFVISENLLVKFLLFHLGYVTFISVLFVAWTMSSNYFMSVSFITGFFWVVWLVFFIGYFPLILVSFVYIGYMMITIKEINDMMERGIPEDEAYSRKTNRRMK